MNTVTASHLQRLKHEHDAAKREYDDLSRKLKYEEKYISASQLRIHRNRKKDLSKQLKNLKVQIELLQ